MDRDELATSQSLERDVSALLDVSPSPRLLARVRAEIAAGERPRALHLSWWPFALGGAGLAMVLGLAVIFPGAEVPTLPARQAAVASRLAPSPAAVDASRPERSRARRSSRPMTAAVVVEAHRPPSKPPVVAPARALAALRAVSRYPDVAAGTDVDTLDPAEAARPAGAIDTITITPVAIAPLPPLPTLEGDRR